MVARIEGELLLADLLTQITLVAACVIKVSVADVRVMSRSREERQQIATCHTLHRARYFATTPSLPTNSRR